MLVVDDEPDNLDLLYRTFRRDFQVFKAESGATALEILANEGEVAVIISDQRMPEMKGTEFLSRTVPQFPNTVRIILTGFTDIEDLVEAINSGQVYKYITKPWDPNELKTVVGRAAETYEVLIEKIEDLRRAEAQTNLLATVVQVAQEAGSPEDCLEPLAVAFGKNFAADVCIFQLVKDGTLGAAASYSHSGAVANWLGSDPLVKEAIGSREVQLATDVSREEILSGLSHYQSSGIQSHLVFPITYRQELLGVLSLQWQEPFHLREDELATIHLCGKQVAIALACTLYHP